jgi:hypothetical protein
MRRILTGEALLARAKELGISTRSGAHKTVSGIPIAEIPLTEYELQARVREAEGHLRESRLWIVALVSALASLASALAAWFAVLR